MPSAVVATIPADGITVPANRAQFRANWLAIKTELDHGGYVTDPTTAAAATGAVAASNLYSAIPLAQGPVQLAVLPASDPPTQDEAQAVADKIDEMLIHLRLSRVVQSA